MTARLFSVTALVALLVAGCSQSSDTIEEIERGVNGTKVELEDGSEYYFRHGIDCNQYDRVWECATQDDLLTERERKAMRPLISPRP